MFIKVIWFYIGYNFTEDSEQKNRKILEIWSKHKKTTFLGVLSLKCLPMSRITPKKLDRFVGAVILSNFAEESMKKFPAVCEIKPKNGYF